MTENQITEIWVSKSYLLALLSCTIIDYDTGFTCKSSYYDWARYSVKNVFLISQRKQVLDYSGKSVVHSLQHCIWCVTIVPEKIEKSPRKTKGIQTPGFPASYRPVHSFALYSLCSISLILGSNHQGCWSAFSEIGLAFPSTHLTFNQEAYFISRSTVVHTVRSMQWYVVADWQTRYSTARPSTD